MDFVFKRSYRGPLRAIIFDWAGTTVDYGSLAPAMVFVEVFRQQDVEISLQEARGPMGTAKRDHIRQLTQTPAIAKRWLEAHGSQPSEADVKAMYQAFVPLQLEALVNHADLISGTVETVADCRRRGMKIGSNTGYNREMLELLLTEAKARGYEPDSAVAASEVPAGRPAPWMSLLNAQQMGVYPMEAIVKVDDTVPGIAEGLNAGMWTIGLTKTGNEIGLNEAETNALDLDILQLRLNQAQQKMSQAGAHYVIEGIWDIPAVLDDINARLAHGERP